MAQRAPRVSDSDFLAAVVRSATTTITAWELTSLKKGSARNRVDDLRNKHGLDITWTSQKRKADEKECGSPSKHSRSSKSPSKQAAVKKEPAPPNSEHGSNGNDSAESRE